jgi:hypothetical protein
VVAGGARAAGRPRAAHRRAQCRRCFPAEPFHFRVHASACGLGLDRRPQRAALAQELVGLQPDIILSSTTPATIALQRETRTIPIVFAGVGDPVASGIVPRLNQPGENITGFALFEATLPGKWLELLSEIAPGLKRAAIMFNPDAVAPLAYMPSFATRRLQ